MHVHLDQSSTPWLEPNSPKEENSQHTACNSDPLWVELFTVATAFTSLELASTRSRLTSWKDPKESCPEFCSADIIVSSRVLIF
jgi:hypothetical protein